VWDQWHDPVSALVLTALHVSAQQPAPTSPLMVDRASDGRMIRNRHPEKVPLAASNPPPESPLLMAADGTQTGFPRRSRLRPAAPERPMRFHSDSRPAKPTCGASRSPRYPAGRRGVCTRRSRAMRMYRRSRFVVNSIPATSWPPWLYGTTVAPVLAFSSTPPPSIPPLNASARRWTSLPRD
jgi:hypothetical protein